MPKYEFMVLDNPTLTELNLMGEKGYEIKGTLAIATHVGRVYLQRSVPDTDEEKMVTFKGLGQYFIKTPETAAEWLKEIFGPQAGDVE